jgi:hypothetical protein
MKSNILVIADTTDASIHAAWALRQMFPGRNFTGCRVFGALCGVCVSSVVWFRPLPSAEELYVQGWARDNIDTRAEGPDCSVKHLTPEEFIKEMTNE